MTKSRIDKLEELRENRLIRRIIILITASSFVLGIAFYLSGRKIETEIKEKTILFSQKKLDTIEKEFLKKLNYLDTSQLKKAQKENINGIKSLFIGFKGSEVSDSLIHELSNKIDKLNSYPKR